MPSGAPSAPPAADPALLELVAAHADRAERERALGSEVVAALRDRGLARMLVPSELGGGEAGPGAMWRTVEAVAQADGAAGWCVAIAATSGLAAAYLAEQPARELFGAPEAIGAGAFAPRGKLSADGPGRWRLSGRWPLASGISHATSVGLGCVHPERGPLYAVLGREEVEVLDTWDALGLRASASHDVVADAVAVPDERLVALVGGAPRARAPLYAFPLFGLLAVAVAAVCTGIARGALGDAVAAAGARTPTGSTRALADRATAQERVAAAEGALRAARAGLDAAVGAAWERAGAGEPLGVGERVGLRLAATHAARTALRVTDAAHGLGGAAAVYRSSALERRLRDVHTATQHMVVAPATLELCGRLLLGREADTGQL